MNLEEIEKLFEEGNHVAIQCCNGVWHICPSPHFIEHEIYKLIHKVDVHVLEAVLLDSKAEVEWLNGWGGLLTDNPKKIFGLCTNFIESYSENDKRYRLKQKWKPDGDNNREYFKAYEDGVVSFQAEIWEGGNSEIEDWENGLIFQTKEEAQTKAILLLDSQKHTCDNFDMSEEDNCEVCNPSNKQITCECIGWARTFDEELFSVHAPTCPHRNIEVESKLHILTLIEALEYEANQGDGINEDYFEAYEAAKFFIGQKIGDKNDK